MALARQSSWGDEHTIARTDWLETVDAHVFKADLPGLTKEDITVQLEDDRTLSIYGERPREESDDKDHWHHVERFSSTFERHFRLPPDSNYKLDDISAHVEDGVLTITVPKEKNSSAAAVRKIEVS